MPNKFIHVKEEDFELIFNLETIQYVRRTELLTWIHFQGDRNPLTLRGESAKRIWRFMLDHSPTIYIATPGAALDNKNAESLTEQESSE